MVLPIADLERTSDAFSSTTPKPQSSAAIRADVVFPIPGGPLIKACRVSAHDLLAYGLWRLFLLTLLLPRAPESSAQSKCQANHALSHPMRVLILSRLPTKSSSFKGRYFSTHKTPLSAAGAPAIDAYVTNASAAVATPLCLDDSLDFSTLTTAVFGPNLATSFGFVCAEGRIRSSRLQLSILLY